MRKEYILAVTVLVYVFLTSHAPAQTVPASPAMQEADALFQGQKWEEAARAYEAVVKVEPSNGRAWYRLGMSYHSMERYEKAAASFQKAVDIGQNPVAMYNLACAYARLNEKDKAFEWLNRALNSGFPQPARVRSDPDFASLRGDARFQQVSALAERLARPCAALAEHRQFDFWVGEWDVKDPQGNTVGTNVIKSIEDGCIILEDWAGSLGGTGKSFNFYDSALKKWRQTWVDSAGNVSEFAGEYRDGALRYEGEAHRQNGTKVLNRLTFFNLGPDRVRQFSEISTDGGKTWTVSYDFTYIRKKK